LTVSPLMLNSVALNPTSVVGEGNSTGTVTLSGPVPVGGAVVTLASNNTAAATVPASVTVAAGAATATFTVTSTAVSATTTATISATYGTTQTAILTVTPPALSSLTLNPASVTAGSNSTGTVTLSGPAPSGGAVVTLTSSNTAAATVPASVTVLGSQTTATFTVSTSAVSSTTSVTISASFGGTTKQATLTVTVNSPGISVTNVWKIQAASSTTGAVTLGTGNGTGSSTTAGRLLVVGIACGGNGATDTNHAISDNVDGTTGWVKVGGRTAIWATTSLWYKKNIPAGLNQITVNGGANVNGISAFVHEVSGASTSAPFTSGEYAAAGSSNTRSSIPTGSITTGTANSVLFAVMVNGANSAITMGVNSTGSNPSTWALKSTTYSQETNAVTYWAGSMPYVIVNAKVTNAVHYWTVNQTTYEDGSVIAAFH